MPGITLTRIAAPTPSGAPAPPRNRIATFDHTKVNTGLAAIVDRENARRASLSPAEPAMNPAETFVFLLYTQPAELFTVTGATGATGTVGVLDNLFGTVRPKTVRHFLSALRDDDLKSLVGAVDGANMSNIVEMLEGSAPLVEELKKLGPSSTSTVPTFATIGSVINPTSGLHLLLANPMVSAVVMAQRKLQTAAAAARVIPVPSGFPFGAFGPGANGLNITVTQKGGAELDPSHPIEMRGGGQMIAAMKGGFGPFFLGTASSPTSWRPVDDNSFISIALEQALASLKGSLPSGSTLDASTDNEVKRLVKELKDAEVAVKKHRDALNDMNRAIASGDADVRGKTNITMPTVIKTAEAYNQSMKNRQKLENKLFRVVIALGGKVIHP